MRLPPAIFTQDQALGLVMGVVEGHSAATGTGEPAGQRAGRAASTAIPGATRANVAKPDREERHEPACCRRCGAA